MPLAAYRGRLARRECRWAVYNEDAIEPFAKRMPEASDKGSQPYRRAYGYGEMAGMGLPPII